MFFKTILSTSYLLFLCTNVFAQWAKILAGPMLGYCEHTEIMIWVMTGNTQKLTVNYMAENNIKDKKSIEIILFDNPKDPQRYREEKISKIILTDLTPGTKYIYSVLLDAKEQKFDYPLSFNTKEIWEWRAPAPDFKFLAGSCNYVNDSAFDRPGQPYGHGTEIFNTMANTEAQLMIWLGDNTYLREADYSSESGIQYRYAHTRKDKNLQRFFATQPNYAIWDDHDYGSDDASRSFGLKEATKKTFIEYWCNKTYGENSKGIYSKITYSDCDFFLTDDRTFRDDSKGNELVNPQKTQLGATQLQWLQNELINSKATFKFVCMGGQFLNENTDKESYNLFKTERHNIVQFITDNHISGVIFISGDRHHSELIKKERPASKKAPGGYTLYDITSSPLTSGVDNI
ncbi:MAG: alkaline phosphatase D family protein [Bacteroidetes bacterium]|nr:alkaline phosphatase D family protein [Bacteroidota bacterium]